MTHLSSVHHGILGHKLHLTSFILDACLSCIEHTHSLLSTVINLLVAACLEGMCTYIDLTETLITFKHN
jgi:hypothetical protein